MRAFRPTNHWSLLMTYIAAFLAGCYTGIYADRKGWVTRAVARVRGWFA